MSGRKLGDLSIEGMEACQRTIGVSTEIVNRDINLADKTLRPAHSEGSIYLTVRKCVCSHVQHSYLPWPPQ